MRVIIAGGREYSDYNTLKMVCDKKINLHNTNNETIVIVSGVAPGADSLGEKYVEEKNYAILQFPAQWGDIKNKPKYEIGKYWKLAGFERNKKMAKHGHMLIAFWDGKSKGTKHMIDEASEK